MNNPYGVIPFESSLGQFLCGYYHQDWQLDDRTWDAVVLRFKRQNPPELVRETAGDLERLLAQEFDESRLDTVLFKELRLDWDPRPVLSLRAWLSGILQLLRSGAHAA